MAKLRFHSILVLCTGNLCRSPIGEQLLRQALPQMRVESAGTCGVSGQPADATAMAVAAGHGLSLSGHVARKVTAGMLRDVDLILVMEPAHIEQVTVMAPDVRGKTLLFGQWLGGKKIPDPYGKSREAFEHVYSLLAQATQEWAKRLS
ncbi:low molecular weight protein-tyrosine-phosphatase [Trabulsiella guamensis ATCC 49490]|uniref:protein-tyrosine-phosphatase n=1 Tax=Trabulsiella guamensis ATCC 49490 TaxID=1005994 RepID=A0A085A515_9ENTR|nr:protein-tyrosine-phosphatase [Trabulsiella guamensis]KFC05310.1 low molecular weight protein-tyrosine-phosphatase [Trabulsiella guamensis ATCC 49490]